MYKKVLCCIMLVLGSNFVYALDLSLASLYQYSPTEGPLPTLTSTEDLYTAIRRADEYGVLSLKLSQSDMVPKSVLEAASVSEQEDALYLHYGYLKVTEHYYDFVIKLYDRDAQKVQKVFYAKNNLSEYRQLIDVMSERITAYFSQVLGMDRQIAEMEKELGVLALDTGLGYWFPLSPYAESLIGLFSFHSGLSLWPEDPLFKWDIFSFAVGYGGSLDYSLGINREGFEGYTLHSLRIGLPVSFSARWHIKNKVVVSLSPVLLVDLMWQDRKYAETLLKRSAAFSVSSALGYEYLYPNKDWAIGAALRAHVAFYKEASVILEPLFYCRFKLKSTNGEE